MTKYPKITYLAPCVVCVSFKVENGYDSINTQAPAEFSATNVNNPSNPTLESYSWSDGNDKSSLF